MKRYTATELRGKIGEILQNAESGEMAVVFRHNEAAALIVPVTSEWKLRILLDELRMQGKSDEEILRIMTGGS